MMRCKYVLWAWLGYAALPLALAGGPPADAEAAVQALFREYWEWRLHESPELAMSVGDYRFADRISDASLAAIARQEREMHEFQERARKIDRELLNPDERVNYDLFTWELATSIDGEKFREFLAPIGGRFGPQQEIPQMGERVRFRDATDFENYLKRLELVPAQVDALVERLKTGVQEGRTPPQITLTDVPAQFDRLLAGGLDALAEPFEKKAAGLSREQAAALRKHFDELSLPAVKSALTKLAQYFRADYLPACRTGIAATEWPDGAAYYAYMVRTMTTTDLKPEQIHALGLGEVARIRAEMMQVIRTTDFLATHPDASRLDEEGLFKAFVAELRTNPRFYHKSAADLLTAYRDVSKRIDAELPHLFRTLPRLSYGVRPIPDFMAPSQTTAYYQPGDLKNGEAGTFYANTYQLDQRPKYEMMALAMHEAVPGHHLQIALAQELPEAPEFRKRIFVNAFGEGWALYSERLGLEVGLYNDPYDNFGRLLYEMWRACRLVVDPGMHALGWSREQAIQYMKANTALSDLNIRTEIDRYIAWPGQATAYKVGELRIRALRRLAEQRLGAKFDVREFHDVILGGGALPLTLLEKRVDEWLGTRTGE